MFVFDDVTSVGYVKRVRRASGAIVDVERRFELRTSAQRRSVKLDGAKVQREEKQELWSQLVAISQHAIEPQLRDSALNRMQRHDQPFVVGKLSLSRQGFVWRGALRRRELTWPEHVRTIYSNSMIKVYATAGDKDKDKDKDKEIAALGTEVLNAVLLPKLMAACTDAFSRA